MPAPADRRLTNLRAALGFLLLAPRAPELRRLHRLLDTWAGLGLVVAGMRRHGYQLSLGDHVAGDGSRSSTRAAVARSPSTRRALRRRRRRGGRCVGGRLDSATPAIGKNTRVLRRKLAAGNAIKDRWGFEPLVGASKTAGSLNALLARLERLAALSERTADEVIAELEQVASVRGRSASK